MITAICFANNGNRVYVYDKIKEKLDKLKASETPFFEENLASNLDKAISSNNLTPVYNLSEGFEKAEIIFICVATPCKENGIDLSQLYSVCEELAPLIKSSSSRKIIVIRSTVIPGTTIAFTKKLEELSSKKYPQDFGVIANPEFLRQGDAIQDFLNHNKVIIGSENEEDAKTLKQLYEPLERPIILLSTKTAEMAKYVNNCLSATKISFINEMGLIAKEFDVDINEISQALDLRVGPGNFPLKAGCGFGGSCLEKDMRALLAVAHKENSPSILLESTISVNDSLPIRMVNNLENKLGPLERRKIGILGLSFKRGTDDIRNSRSVPIIIELKRRNATIFAYDPKATEKMKSVFSEISYCETAQELIDKSEAVVILADWEEFSDLDYRDKIILDGRNVIPKAKRGKNYEGVCWP
ncbi:nucleotide sugar dehydrogenase [Patescibacteria group bacterium]|nr:nucleotide sugar dehydrogenase [Patescibacteria group bacterium]